MTPSPWSKSKQIFTASLEAGGVFDIEVIDARSGICVLKVSGKNAVETFKNEAGGHRWQRIPPNEKRGRVHTSTVTVAVLSEPTEAQISIRPEDIEETQCRGSGNGGQHKQKTDSAVQVKHKPTGLIVRCENGRSQSANRETALSLLKARLWEAKQNELMGVRADERKRQVGSGMRGDKRRTIRVQDGTVYDHLTGKSWQYKQYSRGDW
jgi:peptide chain release factor 1